jgi:cell division protein ZapA (FtsZ GTPase activity inhibitor)
MNSEIRILGQKFPIKTTEQDTALSSEVIALVAKRLEQAEKRFKSPSQKNTQNVTLLALLDLAEEYVRAKRRTESHLAELNAKIYELTEVIAGNK